MRIKQHLEEDSIENIFWVTMTDLMLGLVLVFIILFLYSYISTRINTIQQENAIFHTNKTMEGNFKQNKINAKIDPITGVVKISDLELFELNSYELSNKGKEYLSKFTPIYFNSITSDKYYSENIDKIIIQGHTDSQTYKGNYSKDEQYMKNMELSLKRAYSVANYMVNTNYNKKEDDKFRKLIIVEGASYSTPVLNAGKEDYAKSRRVELKVIMKAPKDTTVLLK